VALVPDVITQVQVAARQQQNLTAVVREHFCREGERPHRSLVAAVARFAQEAAVADGDNYRMSPLDATNLRMVAAVGPMLDQNPPHDVDR
jgi:hypothetical protein